jgi:Flp pilus assembly protein TadG
MQAVRYSSYPRARRAAVVVYTAICMTVVMGMAALAVDIGALYQAQAELQRSADGAALAAAGQLVAEGADDPQQAAADAAEEITLRNPVLGSPVHLNSATDVEYGRAVYSTATGQYEFEPGGDVFDSVRVTVRRTEDSENGPIELMFAKFLGHDSRGLEARAAAVLVPRDIAVVIDVSGSMTYDSQLKNWNRQDGGYTNTRDIWCALDGPEPDRPYLPAEETDTEYASDTGPTIGAMSRWGNPLIPNAYSAASDPGLWYVKKGGTLTDANALASLTARGYSNGEITRLKSGANDGSTFINRLGAILGLAKWHSGMPGGAFPRAGVGDGDGNIENDEMEWISYPSYRVGWTWTTFINYVQINGNGNQSGVTHPDFQYRYGLKTYVDFLLNNQWQNNQTSNLWSTPEQPLRAIKDAVQSMTDVIAALDSLDHTSLEIFATDARHQVNLSNNLQAVPDRLYQIQAAHYNFYTCIGGGLSKAIAELQSTRARPNAHKVILLMSDGVPNVDGSGGYVGDGGSASTYATSKAQQAADLGYVIYTISVGFQADRPLMQEIARIGHGKENYAAGNPEEYTEQLNLIFRALGGKRQVTLIE